MDKSGIAVRIGLVDGLEAQRFAARAHVGEFRLGHAHRGGEFRAGGIAAQLTAQFGFFFAQVTSEAIRIAIEALLIN
ncbi:hypothetical protein [Novosphingobium aquae]|uniref:Uncharacterized protein n=1 Tax=Novosphingobium aquae TaxID=3133435 RepID=A0ABU8SCD1_9SPHN